ncbi:MAG: hypothetical protein FWE98_04195 [Oscillospiraceae bacterium]|nr:hypothetical protein [Oscillospiraceae bacterium]
MACLVGDLAFLTATILHNPIKVTTVSPEYLLAMKLMSARYGEKDYEDIRFLLGKTP